VEGLTDAMLATGERPRELHWYHAGPMLFGDWGTSRLYVLGLAFLYTRHASFWFILAMCVLMIGVGWSYEIICRLFPDGGGVYSSARHRSQLLAVIGGLLLCADYVVTASLSCLDAFHYLGIKEYRLLGLPVDAVAAAGTILLVGGLNYFGPKKAGTVAMVVALATVALTLVIGLYCLPHLREARLTRPPGRPWDSWVGFTEMILALSGVEAIANMTGIMVPPVEKTARKAILPVLVEIVILNLILAAAMNALPDAVLFEKSATNPDELAHTGDMLKVIAAHYVGPTFAALSSIVFAALLLSAVNTALADLVSIQFMLSRDRELPHVFSGLNRFGMPLLPLVVGMVIPAVVVLIFSDVEKLAGLYAIGVVGAISINLGTTSTNPQLPLRAWERAFMFLLTLIMVCVGLTICYVKPHARSFALLVLVVGLAGRLATIVSNKAAPIPAASRRAYLGLAIAAVALIFGLSLLGESKATLGQFDVPGLGRRSFGMPDMAFLLSAGVALAVGHASYRTQSYREALLAAEHAAAPAAPLRPLMIQPGAYTPKMRIMVATQGNPRLIEFAIKTCKSRQAELQILFIRLLAVTPMGTTTIPTLAEDEHAQALFERLREQAKEAGVPLRLLYGVARDIPDAILDMAVTHGADQLLLGATRRGALWKVMKGDVIQAVAEQLPEGIDLLIHA
jgi:amino acid transporter